MVPELLSSNLCSLRSNVDRYMYMICTLIPARNYRCLCMDFNRPLLLSLSHRLAFSCIWEMNHKAEILKTRFTKSIINSKVSHVNITIILEKKAVNCIMKTMINRLDNKVFFLINDLYFIRIRKWY